MDKRSNERESKGKKKLIIISVIAAILVLCAVFAIYMMFFRKTSDNEVIQLGDELIEDVTEKTPVTGAGDDRAIAVMIDNHKDALPHGGLDKAMIIYEIIVEGGESRLMAIFKGQDVEKIGPVRSSRHYFLDYAFENDAIYVHYGWSPKAQSDISTLGVNNINGISESEQSFWRTKDKYAPHNVATSTKDILEIAERKGYRTKSDSSLLLNYVAEDFELQGEDAIVAEKIQIPYSDSNIVKYEYDKESKKYIRYSKGVKETDWDTKEAVKVKNIIVECVRNTKLADTENKDRQELNNIGEFEGYYITNGKAIKITATKETRKGKTIYKDLQGNEINVNDGNTFIQICPIDSKVKISAEENV